MFRSFGYAQDDNCGTVMKKILLMILLLACMLPADAQEKIVLRLMGDSTMADKDLSYCNPERGWGQRLPAHLDDGVEVVNYAKNGRSTKSFRTLGHWDLVKADLKEGDYLFIQFGHNDSKTDDPERSAPAFGLYQENLRVFIDYALSVGARPVLFTPVSRRWFDDGKLQKDCHGDYPEAIRQIASEYGLPLIDANSITQAWLEGIGDEASRPYYMWVEKGVNPRHPDGKTDNTHTNVAGARKLVELLLPEIVKVIPELAAHVDEYDFVVAKDGSGDFFTVQDAVNAAPDYFRHGEIKILIREGIYREKVVIPSCKQRLHLVGRSAESTVITWNDYALKNGSTGYTMGTSATSTVFLYGDDFLAENITVENSSGEGKAVGQACAITVDADRAAFLNCRFIANQDTIYTYGKGKRQYFGNCLIEGTTDFIFGASTVFFDNCGILSKKDSYVTAASTPEGARFGYVFRNCRFLHADGVSKVYLGRPWRPFAKTVVINCYLGDHILKDGWHNWNKPYAEKTVFYAEYGNEGPGAYPQKERVKWSHRLKAKDIGRYIPETVLEADTEIDKNGAKVRNEWFFKVF